MRQDYHYKVGNNFPLFFRDVTNKTLSHGSSSKSKNVCMFNRVRTKISMIKVLSDEPSFPGAIHNLHVAAEENKTTVVADEGSEMRNLKQAVTNMKSEHDDNSRIQFGDQTYTTKFTSLSGTPKAATLRELNSVHVTADSGPYVTFNNFMKINDNSTQE